MSQPAPTPATVTATATATTTTKTAAATPAAVNAPAPTEALYGPVEAGESVSLIGFKLRPDEGVTGAQMAWALFLANPDAFVHGDIHNLRVGTSLRVPTREMALATPYAEARKLIRFGAQAPRPTGGPKAADTPSAAGETSAPEEKITDDTVAGPLNAADMPTGTAEARAPAQAPAEHEMAEQPPEDRFRLKLLSADEERALPNPTARDPDPLQEFDGTNLPQIVQAARTQAQELAVENQRLSARLAAAEQKLRALQAEAETREQELQQLRERLAEAEARRRQPPGPATGVAMTEAALPVAGDTVPREAPPEPAAESMPLWSVLGQGLALVAIVALLVWLMIRRQRRAADAAGEFADARFHPPDQRPGTTEASAPWAAANVVRAGDSLDAGSPSAADAVQELDPVAHAVSEAELCLAYGQCGVAEGILQRLVDSAPRNAEHRLRLLHVLHAARKHESYMQHAKALLALVGDKTSATWREAAELGLELFPDEAIFQAAPVAEDQSPFEATVPMEMPSELALPETAREQEASTEHAPVDTQHLDFQRFDERASEAEDSAYAQSPAPLDLEIGETRDEAVTPQQADMDLTDELLAWDPAGSDPDPAPDHSEGDARQPASSDEQGEELGTWDELTFSALDEEDAQQGEGEGADESEAARSAAAGKD